jgi:hypothetical protein
MKIITLFFEHITNWGLVWFGVIFWGSIFNATSTYFFQNSYDLAFTLLAYLLGLTLGLLAKYRGWVWIN